MNFSTVSFRSVLMWFRIINLNLELKALHILTCVWVQSCFTHIWGLFEIEHFSKYFFRLNLPFNTWAKSLKLEAHQISFLHLLIPSDFWVWNPRHIYIKNTILDAWGWCTGTTQRDGMGREKEAGFRMGNTCIPVVDSFWYMAKPIQYCKVKK